MYLCLVFVCFNITAITKHMKFCSLFFKLINIFPHY